MSKLERITAEMLTKGVLYSSLGAPPGSEYAVKKFGKYSKDKLIEKVKAKNSITR